MASLFVVEILLASCLIPICTALPTAPSAEGKEPQEEAGAGTTMFTDIDLSSPRGEPTARNIEQCHPKVDVEFKQPDNMTLLFRAKIRRPSGGTEEHCSTYLGKFPRYANHTRSNTSLKPLRACLEAKFLSNADSWIYRDGDETRQIGRNRVTLLTLANLETKSVLLGLARGDVIMTRFTGIRMEDLGHLQNVRFRVLLLHGACRRVNLDDPEVASSSYTADSVGDIYYSILGAPRVKCDNTDAARTGTVDCTVHRLDGAIVTKKVARKGGKRHVKAITDVAAERDWSTGPDPQRMRRLCNITAVNKTLSAAKMKVQLHFKCFLSCGADVSYYVDASNSYGRTYTGTALTPHCPPSNNVPGRRYIWGSPIDCSPNC